MVNIHLQILEGGYEKTSFRQLRIDCRSLALLLRTSIFICKLELWTLEYLLVVLCNKKVYVSFTTHCGSSNYFLPFGSTGNSNLDILYLS